MSYDFDLFKPEPGVDAETAARLWLAANEIPEDSDELDAMIDLNPGPPDPEAAAQNQRLTKALRDVNPLFEVYEDDIESITGSNRSPEQGVREHFMDLELDDPESDLGITILLFKNEAAITVPYWHSGTRAEATFQEIWKYVELIQREASYITYDPQIEKVLDLDNDLPLVLKTYAIGVDYMARVAQRATPTN